MNEIRGGRGTLYSRHGSTIGQPLSRREGTLKVTGAAVYAADHSPEGLLHAVIATSDVANGRVVFLDEDAARAHPGVVEVMTPRNRPSLAVDPAGEGAPFGWRLDLLQNDKVRYHNQPIAVVIAETLEAASEGARLLSPRYEVGKAITDFDSAEPFLPESTNLFGVREEGTGNVESGFAAAAELIEEAYDTPAQYHNPLEPHSILATWDADRLVVETPSQGVVTARARIAELFGIPVENIHVHCLFLGGGFGSKGFILGPQILGIMAARLVGRPVKLVLKRSQMFGPVGHRARSRQTIKLGLTEEGRLLAIHHRTRSATSVFDEFIEPASRASHTVYATPAILTQLDGVRTHVGTPTYARAPGEATGTAALEIAIDEAAYAFGADPMEFRLRNYAEVEPISGKPFSSKALRECYAQGAERFGWAGRPVEPRQMRDDEGFLLGWGLGTATFPSFMGDAKAKATIRADGSGIVESSSADMGQGAWTAFAQIASDSLSLPLERIEFRAGDSNQPDAGIAGGSAHTATVGTALLDAGANVVAKLAALAAADRQSPLWGTGNAGLVARDGALYSRDDETLKDTYVEILARAGLKEVEADGRSGRDPAASEYAMHAHGAVFAEVRVDPDLGQIRVTRMVGAFAAGRIINPRMVRSQYYGGMIWGLSFALHEEAIIDPRSGRIMNADLAGYHVPVNADIASLETILVEEHDPYVNALGLKGVGELGITGTAGAIANAVWHATGVRTRRYPIRIVDLLNPAGG